MRLLLLVLLGMTQVGWGQTQKGELACTPNAIGFTCECLPEGATCSITGASSVGQSPAPLDVPVTKKMHHPRHECILTEDYWHNHPCEWPYSKPEPVDVPAIQVPLKDSDHVPLCLFPNNQAESCWDVNGNEKKGPMGDSKARLLKRWTCADKSRILLHSENGKHWCHLVQP
jgi:hypothetical protein